MLGPGRDDVRLAPARESRPRRACRAEDGQVVGFGGARGPDDLRRGRANQAGDLRARRPRPVRVRAGRRHAARPGCQTHRFASGTRSWQPRRAGPPAWSRRSPYKSDPRDTRRDPRSFVLTRTTPVLLHGCQDPAQYVGLVGIELRALQQPSQAIHQVRAALRAIAKIDQFEHLGEMLRTAAPSPSAVASGSEREAAARWMALSRRARTGSRS